MTGYTHLFVPGPTNMPERIRRSLNLPMEDIRSPALPDLTLPLFEDLKKVFKTETGKVFIFPGTGTGGWEAAISNTLNPGDKVLMSQFGQFSLLWVDMCQRFGLDVQALDVEWGKGVPLEDYARILEADKNHEIKAVFACQNETTTGVASDIPAVRKILDDLGHPALFFVDGVSSIASVDFRMDEWGVDLAVSGSQKGFMLPTGLSIVGASQKALEAHKTSTIRRCYFDFSDMLRTNKDGYFPYTPATTLLRGLRESVNMLLEEGLENVFARHYRIAEGVRRAVIDGWKLDTVAVGPEWYSDTVTSIRVPEGFDSNAVTKTAFHRYNLSLGVGLNKVAGKAFRIGHLGELNELMIMTALSGAEMAMRDNGILSVEPGSGVAAAQEYYRSQHAVMAEAAE